MTETALPAAAGALVAESAALAAAFSAAGFRLYLVGGIVRDLYAGGVHDDLDLDFTTEATPDVVKSIVGPIVDALWTQGERFGTIAAKLDGRLVEITTHRAEAYDPESRKPSVVFADDVLVDLSRRDFTVNAMAIELTAERPRLIDPFDGVEHLRTKVLRTPLAPADSFSDDPLRMMRAARFVARLGLMPVPEVVVAISAMTERISVVSVERVREELDKLLTLADPTAGLRLLVDTGLADRFLPELGAGGPEAVDRRIGDVAILRPDPHLRLAAILLGTGTAAPSRAQGLRHSRQVVVHIGSLVAIVERWRDHVGEWTDRDLRRFALEAGEHRDDVLALMAGDGRGDAVVTALGEGLAHLARTEDLDAIRPAIDGDTVMSVLEIAPGREIGAALGYLQELRLEVGPMDRDDTIERLRQWWTTRRA